MKLAVACLLIPALLLLSCSHTGPKPDSEITEEWLEAPITEPQATVSAAEARQFIEHFFGLLDQVIFDPQYRAGDLSRVKREALLEVESNPALTKGGVVSALNRRFKEIRFSHLAVLDPEKSRKIFKMAGGPKNETPEPAVSARMKGKVGIIKVSSFLVPSITLLQLAEARAKTKNAKYMLYDLRNNGGGSVSSNSYLIETILGPGRTIQFSRNRKGLELNAPAIKEGFFPDSVNSGSEADIEFESRHRYVEWKTRKDAVKDPRPAIVIVNSRCGSSCDVFTAAIKESGSARILGTRTAGAVLGAIAYKLSWKAYTAIMPVTQIISPQGKLYEGIGISPDIENKDCENAENENCLNDAIRRISTR